MNLLLLLKPPPPNRFRKPPPPKDPLPKRDFENLPLEKPEDENPDLLNLEKPPGRLLPNARLRNILFEIEKCYNDSEKKREKTTSLSFIKNRILNL